MVYTLNLNYKCPNPTEKFIVRIFSPARVWTLIARSWLIELIESFIVGALKREAFISELDS